MLCLLHGATFLGAARPTAPCASAPTRGRGTLAWPARAAGRGFAVWTPSISDGGVCAASLPRRSPCSPRSLAAVLLSRAGHEGWAFAATAVAIGATVAALFANLYPNVMVSSTERRRTT